MESSNARVFAHHRCLLKPKSAISSNTSNQSELIGSVYGPWMTRHDPLCWSCSMPDSCSAWSKTVSCFREAHKHPPATNTCKLQHRSIVSPLQWSQEKQLTSSTLEGRGRALEVVIINPPDLSRLSQTWMTFCHRQSELYSPLSSKCDLDLSLAIESQSDLILAFNLCKSKIVKV